MKYLVILLLFSSLVLKAQYSVEIDESTMKVESRVVNVFIADMLKTNNVQEKLENYFTRELNIELQRDKKVWVSNEYYIPSMDSKGLLIITFFKNGPYTQVAMAVVNNNTSINSGDHPEEAKYVSEMLRDFIYFSAAEIGNLSNRVYKKQVVALKKDLDMHTKELIELNEKVVEIERRFDGLGDKKRKKLESESMEMKARILVLRSIISELNNKIGEYQD